MEAHMKCMLLIYYDEKAWDSLSETEQRHVVGEMRQFTKQIKSTGHNLAGAPLQPTRTTKSVRIRSGARVVTDGPFAETREQLGGYFLVDVRDLDEAIGIAAHIPAARWGTVEVRPLGRPCDDDSISV